MTSIWAPIITSATPKLIKLLSGYRPIPKGGTFREPHFEHRHRIHRSETGAHGLWRSRILDRGVCGAAFAANAYGPDLAMILEQGERSCQSSRDLSPSQQRSLLDLVLSDVALNNGSGTLDLAVYAFYAVGTLAIW